MTKSYVSLEQKVCPVCNTVFETNNILLDNRGRNRLDRHTVTGYALCPTHQQQCDEGYLHLVVANGPDSNSSRLHLEDASYTGEIISIKREVAKQVFDIDLDDEMPMVYIEPAAAAIIKSLVAA